MSNLHLVDKKMAAILDEVKKVFGSTGFNEFVVDGETFRSDRQLDVDISDQSCQDGGLYRLEIHLKKESEL